MRKFWQAFLVAGMLATGVVACSELPTVFDPEASSPMSSLSGDPAATAQYILLMRSNAIPADLAARVQAAGGQVVRTLPQVGIVVASSSAQDFPAAMRADSRIEAVGIDPVFSLPSVVVGNRSADLAVPTAGPTPDDDLFLEGFLWGVERVNAPAAWAGGHTGSHQTVVAILDTGIASNHPDLAANIVFNACFTWFSGDHMGDWVPGAPCNPYPEHPDGWHGTHVAGTVAAAFGGGRVVGVAPNLAIANYNVFEHFPGFGLFSASSARWAAMIDAADRGFDVINMSLGGLIAVGGPWASFAATFLTAERRVQTYVNQAGTTIVSSAGNRDFNLNGPVFHNPSDQPGSMSVAATGIRPNPRYEPDISFDIRAFYSNYGAALDVAAPGGDCGELDGCTIAGPDNWFEFLVLSAFVYPEPDCAKVRNCPVDYEWAAGTSMAAPHVSGVAGLVKDANPRFTPEQVVSTIRRTAERLGNRQEFGHGMPNAAAAMGFR